MARVKIAKMKIEEMKIEEIKIEEMKIGKKIELRMASWILIGVIWAASSVEAAEYWQNEPYDPYHSQYRYSQGGRYPESGEYAPPENRGWQYGGGYGDRGYAAYPPESAGRDPRGYVQQPPQQPRGGYERLDFSRGGEPPQQPQRRRSGPWYPPENVPPSYTSPSYASPSYTSPSYAPAPQGGYPGRGGYPPQNARREAPRDYAAGYDRRYPEPQRNRSEYPGNRQYPPENVQRGYVPAGPPQAAGYGEPPAYGGGEYPRGAREYGRDPRGGYVPAPPREYGGREYGGYGYPEGGGYSRGGWGYPRQGYFNVSDEYFQERYENILQEYLGRREGPPPSPYYPYRY